MKEILKSKYASFFLAGLVLNILGAWFSAGFYHADEHFQILEFCNYKMGYTDPAILVWEFHQKIRASLLPGIAFVIAKIMYWFKVYNPFILAFLLRLFTGIASWFITCKLCLLLSRKMKSPIAEKLLILMSLFLWFIPYLTIRYTPENISGIAFLYGIYFVLTREKKPVKTTMAYILVGLLWGVAFFLRVQIIFAILGIIMWLILIKKIKLKYIGILAVGGVSAIGINILVDSWFYGEKVFTPFRYYYMNIVLHKAADFGVSPWWFYFSEFIMKGVPPLSIILLIVFFTGLYKNLKDPLVWAITPFILIHFFIGHKELRFLFPVIFMFIYLAALGFDYCLTKNNYLKIHKYIYRFSLILCIPLFLFRTLAPAQASVNYCRFLYNNALVKNTPLFILHNDSDYSMYSQNASFYKSANIKSVSVDSLSQMNTYLSANQPASAFFLDKYPPGKTHIAPIKGYKTDMVYCFYPAWILKYDINKWEQRTQIWSIYRFSKI